MNNPHSSLISKPSRLLLLLFGLSLTNYVIQLVLRDPVGPLWYFDDDGAFRIADLANFLAIIKAFWSGELTRFYDTTQYPTILSKLAGAPVTGAMPLAIPPTALLIWAPFALLSDDSFRSGYLWWNSIGLALCLSSVLIAWNGCTTFSGRRALLLSSLLAGFSSMFLLSMILGQAAPHAVGLLNLLFLRLQLGKDRTGKWFDILLLFSLSLKTPYLLCATVLMLGFQEYRLAVTSLLVTAIVVLMMTAKLGVTWPTDYLQSMSYFLSEHRPAWMAAAFVPDKMLIFTSAATNSIFADHSQYVSKLCFFLGIGVSSLILCMHRTSTNANEKAIPFFVILFSYLLFSPYVGSYEELLIYCPVFILCTLYRLKDSSVLIGLLFMLLLILNFTIVSTWVSLTFVFAVKCLLLVSLYTLVSRRDESI